MSTECFVRLACGRLDPAEAWAEGAITVEGDRALGVVVTEHLNFVP